MHGRQIDAALARPYKENWIDEEIVSIGRVLGVTSARIGLNVQKSGRSTGLTRGQIRVIKAVVRIGFSGGRTALFTNQIVTTKMGTAGDSGSLLLNQDNHAVGLLFAGGNSATIYHPIAEVLNIMQVRFTAKKRDFPSFSDEDDNDRQLRIYQSDLPRLLAFSNVIGVGIGHKEQQGIDLGEPCITFFVRKKLPRSLLRAEDLIPPKIEGIITDVVETGDLVADIENETFSVDKMRYKRNAKKRPAQPGLSIGHYQVTAGTFGAVVYDEQTNEPLILSNNHVLANATNGKDGLSKIGDPILQPGRADGGRLNRDVIGSLLRFHPLQFL